MGKQNMLRLCHHTLLQNFRRVTRLHINRLLGDDRTAIGDRIDKMYGRACDLDTVLKCGFMDAQSVKPFSAEECSSEKMLTGWPESARTQASVTWYPLQNTLFSGVLREPSRTIPRDSK